MTHAFLCTLIFIIHKRLDQSIGNRQKSHSNEACVSTHLITIMPASQLHFLANKNAELAGGSL